MSPEQRHSTEEPLHTSRRKVIVKDLIEKNYAFHFCNLDKALLGPFSLEAYNDGGLAEIFRVEYPDGVKDKIKDGHHRILGASLLDPYMELEVIDRTDFIIQQSVKEGIPGYSKDQRNLLPSQAMVLANDPSVLHTELDQGRIGMAIFTEWEENVTKKDKETLSALGLMALFRGENLLLKSDYNEEKLEQKFPDVPEDKKKDTFNKGAREIGRFIRDGVRGFDDVSSAVASIVINAEHIPENPIKPYEQISGLLYLPNIKNKLESVSDGKVIVDTQKKEALREGLINTFKSLKSVEVPKFFDIIADPELKLDEMIELLHPAEEYPLALNTRYLQTKKTIHTNILKEKYRGPEAETDLSKKIITILAGNYSPNNIDDILGHVEATVHIVRYAENKVATFEQHEETQQADALKLLIKNLLYSKGDALTLHQLAQKRAAIVRFLNKNSQQESHEKKLEPAATIVTEEDLGDAETVEAALARERREHAATKRKLVEIITKLEEITGWREGLTQEEKDLVEANANLQLTEYARAHQMSPDKIREKLRIVKGKKAFYDSQQKK